MTGNPEWAEGKGLTIKPTPVIDMLEGAYYVNGILEDSGVRKRYPAGAMLHKPSVPRGLVGGTAYFLTVDQLRWLVTTGGPAALAFLERDGAA